VHWPDPSRVTYVASAVDARDYPPDDRPEVAVAGRSNVGKSSLINCLLGRRQIARISGTPGKTRTVNFFDADGQFYVVDLPGYGFAKRSKTEREQWRLAVERYLQSRQRLLAMLVLIDIRRGPEVEEELLVELLTRAGIAVIAVFTKADKLPKSQRRLAAEKLARGLGPGIHGAIAFSSKTGEGRQEVIDEVLGWMRLASR
jgi:GTP-binding protein